MSGASALRWALGAAALAGLGLLGGSAARSRLGGVDVVGRADLEGIVPPAAGLAVGPESAPALRVFGDYECPACRDLEREVGDTLRALARSGRIRFVYHHAPLRGHRRGRDAAVAAYCAADAGVGWEAHAALYERAAQWGTGAGGFDGLVSAVASAGADPARVRSCMQGEEARRRAAADRAVADALGITAVPTVYFGDRRLRAASWRALARHVTVRAPAP